MELKRNFEFLQVVITIIVVANVIILCVWVFSLHACLCAKCIHGTYEKQKTVRFPGTGATDFCEPPFEC